MDPYTEKEMLDTLKLIAGSLTGIQRQLADIGEAIREAGADEYEDDDEDDDVEEDEGDEDNESEEGVENADVVVIET